MGEAAEARRARGPRRAGASARDATTRERMLDVALEAFAELGYDGASTREIAGRAGVNQGMIPYYFGSKEALWREAVDRAFAELRTELGEAAGGEATDDDPRRRAQVIRSFVRFVARRPAFARLMNEEGKRGGPRMRWLVDRHTRPMFDAVGALRGTAGSGETRRDAIFFYLLIGAATQIFHQAPECRRVTGVDPTDPTVVEAHADALVELFVPELDRRTES